MANIFFFCKLLNTQSKSSQKIIQGLKVSFHDLGGPMKAACLNLLMISF